MQGGRYWRRKPESNRRTRICNPLHNHSAIAPVLQEKRKRGIGRCFLFVFGAGDESRTRDLNLGKVALYQLSYSRGALRLMNRGSDPTSRFLRTSRFFERGRVHQRQQLYTVFRTCAGLSAGLAKKSPQRCAGPGFPCNGPRDCAGKVRGIDGDAGIEAQGGKAELGRGDDGNPSLKKAAPMMPGDPVNKTSGWRIQRCGAFKKTAHRMERETSLELATSTLARLRSTN